MEKIFVVKNLLSNRNNNGGLFLFPTDVMASVVLAEGIVKGGKDRLEELQLWELGEYDETTNKITLAEPTLVQWDLRRLKEQKMEDKTKEEIEKDLSKY